MELIAYVAGLLAAVGGSWFFSGAETGIYTLSRLRLRYRTQRGSRSARILTTLLASPRGLICTTLIGNIVCNYAATVLVSLILASLLAWPGHRIEITTVVLLTPILFLFTELHPKNTFRVRSDRLMYLLAGPLRMIRVVFFPVTALLMGAARLMETVVGFAEGSRQTAFSRAGLSYFFALGSVEGAISPAQKEMADNIMRLEKRTVADAMVPIEAAAVLRRGASASELSAALRTRRHARLPVHAGSRRQIDGVLSIFDVEDWSVPDVTRYSKPPLRVAGDTPIDEAIAVLRGNRASICIVTDPHGNALGIATVKDLVAEIVGSLQWGESRRRKKPS